MVTTTDAMQRSLTGAVSEMLMLVRLAELRGEGERRKSGNCSESRGAEEEANALRCHSCAQDRQIVIAK
jgi:hypothetical protein